MSETVLILPGLFNSGEGHWQTLWETAMPNARRVMQADWDRPQRAEWVAALDAAVAGADGQVLLVAHSLGCALAAWWAKEHCKSPHLAKVKGALLVAPPDVEHADFPDFVTGFAPMPRDALPFPAIVVASSDDPWCALPRAQEWAAGWQAQFREIGARGHINGDSGLGEWPLGREWIAMLAKECDRSTWTPQ